jgi:hypothetical protein
MDLQRDLSIAAHDAGNPIVSNGSQQSIVRETNNCMFRCGIFYQSTKTSAMELSDLAQYQCISLVNDWKNNRAKGKHFPKRIKTVDQRGCACWFQFVVKWDINFCFYIESNNNQAVHFISLIPSLFIQTQWQYQCIY